MKRIFAWLQYIMRPAIAICLACLLVGPLRAAESAGEMKLQKARVALTGEQKDTVQAKKLLLEIVEKDKDTLDSQSLCYVYVYLGYIEDRAGNRNEAIPWYQKALKIKDADRVQECAAFGLEKPLTWIRHLDEGTEKISLESAPPVVVRTVPMAGGAGVDPALTEIRVTYSKPMQDGSWSWNIWNEENYPETTGKPRYLSDGCTCVLPVNLKPDKFYAIWLNNDQSRNFTDTNGKPAMPYLLTFRTGTSTGAGEQRLKALVENFFAHNYRDITARDTIEWGQVSTDDKGNSSIRYKYRAKIWDKDTVTNSQVFTFDPQDKFVSAKPVTTAGKSEGAAADPPAPIDPLAMRTYTVGRNVSEFPTNADLSTPETAYANWNRTYAAQGPGVRRFNVQRLVEATPDEPAKPVAPGFANELLNSQILDVCIYSNCYAAVIARVPNSLKTIIDLRCFERENGQWLNAGEDLYNNADSAREKFVRIVGYREAERQRSSK